MSEKFNHNTGKSCTTLLEELEEGNKQLENSSLPLKTRVYIACRDFLCEMGECFDNSSMSLFFPIVPIIGDPHHTSARVYRDRH